MSKLKLFFLAIICCFGGLVVSFIDIYEPAKIFYHSTNKGKDYNSLDISKNIQCFKTKDNLTPIQQKKFRLLVWNIHKGEDERWLSTLMDLSENKDFLLLQEMTNQQKIEQKFSTQFPTALFVSAFSFREKMSGIGILSRFIPKQYCGGSKVEPIIRIPKVGSAVVFPLENHQSLLLINLHLINFEVNPTNYSEQLYEIFNVIKYHQGPIILAGDFNAWNKWRFSVIEELTKRYNLKEVIFKEDHRLRFLGNPLDLVFVRGFKVMQATTQETDSSDHNPLIIELELQ